MGGVGVCFCLMVLGGCTPPVSHLTEAQAAAAAVATPDQDKYLLGPEDAIEISVWKEPDLTKQLVVRPDGKITYPLIGEVQAAGQHRQGIAGRNLQTSGEVCDGRACDRHPAQGPEL